MTRYIILVILLASLYLVYGTQDIKSAHKCKDHHPKCVKWAAKGECNKNPKWMLEHCRQSCGQCSQANVHDLLQRAKSQQISDLMIIPYIILAVIIGFSIKIYYSGANCSSDEKLKGKTVIITGANSGIGMEVARDLAWRKARVIMACRDVHKGMKAAAEIVQSAGNMDVEVKKLDLASFASIREFAKEVNEEESRVDVLINNAGYLGSQKKTVDKLEYTLQVNYLGPFLLTNLLLGKLKTSSPSRIINVSSHQHKKASIDFDNLQGEKSYGRFAAYSRSKLALMLFTKQLANKLAGSKVTVNALHPGLVCTNLFRNLRFLRIWAIRPIYWLVQYFFFKTPIQGAQTTIHCAVAPELADVTGKYFVDCQEAECGEVARDEGLGKKLWEKSEELCGISS